jgi:hypothetical protein
MAVWPASLPQTLLQASYRETLPRTKLRTEMDAGPPKMRRRYTAAPRPIQGTQNLTTTQVADLKTFHNTTVAGGSLPFDWTDPIPGTGTVSFRFVSEPELVPVSGSMYRASYEFEIMP